MIGSANPRGAHTRRLGDGLNEPTGFPFRPVSQWGERAQARRRAHGEEAGAGVRFAEGCGGVRARGGASAGCRKWRLIAILILLGIAVRTEGAPDILSSKDPAEDIAGVWKMTARQVYPFLMILRREGHPNPSFWVGRNEPGPFTLKAVHDVLDGSTRIEASGNFVVRAATTPPRAGVPDQVPGGGWSQDRKKMEVALEFQSFSGFRALEPSKQRGTEPPRLRTAATTKGVFRANGKRVPFEGEATFEHSTKRPQWTMRFTGSTEGAALGLTAPFNAPLQIELETESPISDSRPKLDDASDRSAGGILP